MVSTIAVVGAGQMGSGIAQLAASKNCRVLLSDQDLDTAEKATAGIAKSLARLVTKEKLTQEEADAALALIVPTGDLSGIGEASFVIEAATEREDIKAKIFGQISGLLGPDAVLATNTSSIPITRMAAGLPDPARFIGLHFFNPVPVMQLVEVIPGLATAPQTIEATRAFAHSLGKEVVLSADEPGFVVNRILLPMINEAVFVLAQGTAGVADIDKGCRLGLNHPMGPLQLADFIGLDTCLEIMRVILEGTGDPKYRPASLLTRYVEAGWLGRKSGRGFYDYTGEEPVPTR